MAQRLSGRFVAKPMAAINMTPMVPALLAVLVVAMVSSTPSLNAVDVVAPAGLPPPPSVVQPKLIVVTMLGEGSYEIGGERLGADLMKARVTALAAEQGLNRVRVQAEEDMPYGEVVAIIGHLKSVGLNVEFWRSEPAD
jgi:biopolymer transport protein TolR